ncbi:PRAME family member 8-like isoform X1 [Rattus norvegicus]|uniref:PRAME family member 8-like isoform X1 n=1 Tax=Rattus norvegicus TaxID=10116 RepID=UPI00191732C2|nr:PRAME family member 8-like isoform X1 [Rattus norvegicus]
MSGHTPPTLEKLARQTLLRNEAMAISCLGELPTILFPALFKEAFEGRHINLIKEMVAAWPFPCLPVGALMKTPNGETMKALLDGVDMRLTRTFHPKTKLQVLDLRNEHHNFWNIWTGAEDSSHSAENLEEKQVAKVFPRYALRRQRVKVIVELSIFSCLEEQQACFLKWAQERKGSLHFCCTKMTIWDLPVHVIREILKVFDPQHITEFELHNEWTLLELAHFAPYFGQMRHLRKVSLAPLKIISSNRNETGDREATCIKKFISQFSKFNCLQHLSMFYCHFLRDHMNQVLRYLMTPLETLSVTCYIISQNDLDSFSCSQSLFHLKHLELIGVLLYGLDVMPLRGLLEKVADTLETLNLQWCGMKDPQLYALLPALRNCSQLTTVKFYSNKFSMPILKDLLQHTANWSQVNVEQYPAPLECYDDSSQVSVARFSQLCRELTDTHRAIRQPKNISFATEICYTCGKRCVYHNGPRLCCCWQ